MTRTLIALALVASATTACTDSIEDRPVFAQSGPDTSHVARGKYLVTISGCNDCHTPLKMGPQGPSPDVDRALSGHPEQIGSLPVSPMTGPWMWAGTATNTAFAGPWGVSYAANLTPDENTGLGIWTEDMFLKAIRTGKHMATSRPILPPMPWPGLSQATDEDLKAIFAYLRSLKPVSNHVPAAELAGEN